MNARKDRTKRKMPSKLPTDGQPNHVQTTEIWGWNKIVPCCACQQRSRRVNNRQHWDYWTLSPTVPCRPKPFVRGKKKARKWPSTPRRRYFDYRLSGSPTQIYKSRQRTIAHVRRKPIHSLYRLLESPDW